jgi:Calcium-dependent channel, 7TM region, putative phosphate
MRVTILSTVLCIAVILPLNLSARCWSWENGGDRTSESCNSDLYNFTNYERTTLANIPALTSVDNENFFVGRSEILWRLYGIVLCSWVLCIYACAILRQEWIEMLALRRVYYLEFNHWKERKRELQKTLLTEFDESDMNSSCDNSVGDHEKIKKVPKRKDDPVRNRDPWIPHPEQRETVPNISLYSVLIGGLPAAPIEEINQDDVEAAVIASRRQNIDWQLTFAGEYFDRCVPNQPGYSSSIAAITILPSATDLARAWGKWYAAAGKLRRLRHIRAIIRNRVHYDILDDGDDETDDDREFSLPGAVNNPTRNHTPDGSSRRLDSSSTRRRPSIGQKSKPSPRQFNDRNSSMIYELSVEKKVYYRDVLGSSYDGDVDQNNLFLSFEFGPEQTAVYSRELAQSAAVCCPHGCFEGRIARLGIDDLRELEENAKEEVHTANLLLRQAQKYAIVNPQNTEIPLGESAASSHEYFKDEVQLEHSMSYRSYHLATPTSDRKSSIKSTKNKAGVRISKEWDLVDLMVNDAANDSFMDRLKKVRKLKKADTGVVQSLAEFTGWNQGVAPPPKVPSVELKAFVPTHMIDSLARESTYAIVTFTSRQAACAARQCLADGRGLDRWVAYEDIPIPPLADAAPFALCPCRGCCRPVTISLNDKQKLLRYYFSLLLLGSIYVFYTIPLTLAVSLIDPSNLDQLFPGYADWVHDHLLFRNIFSGILPALIWTTFFALCPVMFKTIANFGSNAHSVYKAEFKAMQFYWWFIVLTAFTGSSLANMVIQGFSEGIRIGSEATKVLANVAATIPTLISATWLNWIIVRTTITLPLQYLIQLNSFLFSFLGWKCCSRINRGGGPGGPVPYRIYIDSGVVFLCTVALGPAAPLLPPCSLLYFLFCWPLLRRNLIFVYRPNYDAGGSHWPFLFEILMSSIFTALTLLTTMMALKKAVGPAVLAALPFVPTFFFRIIMHRRFLKAFRDTSLYTSSSLDGWDIDVPTCIDRREEFRRFLVDAHKAAYVPVCLASSAEVLTAEPAIVVSSENDVDLTPVMAPMNISVAKKKSIRPPEISEGHESLDERLSPISTSKQPSARHRSKSNERSGHSPKAEPKPPLPLLRTGKSDSSCYDAPPVPSADYFRGVPQQGSFTRRKPRKSTGASSVALGPAPFVGSEASSRASSNARTSGNSTNSDLRRSSLVQSENQFGVSLRRIAPHYQNQISVHDDGSVSSRFHPLTPSRRYGLTDNSKSLNSFESSDDDI